MLDRTREIGQTKPALKCRRAVLYVLLILFVDLFFCEQYVLFKVSLL